MTVALWCMTIVSTFAVIMFGIYMIAKISSDDADKLRLAQRANAEYLETIQKQRAQIIELKVEIDHLKNRKVHDADSPE